MTDYYKYKCENPECGTVVSSSVRNYSCPKCRFSLHLTETYTMPDPTCNESDNPDHYKTGKLECIDAMRAMLGDEGFVAYIRGTVFKYNWRLGKKDEDTMEAKKIAVYTRWLNETLSGKELSK